MTFSIPNQLGLFFDSAAAAPYNAAKGSIGHYLAGFGSSLRCRHVVASIAAFTAVLEGLLERIVFPFQTTDTMPTLGDGFSGTYGNTEDGTLQNQIGSLMEEAIALGMARSLMLSDARRFLPFDHWKAFLDALVGLNGSCLLPLYVGDSSIVVSPAVLRPESEDVSDTGWIAPGMALTQVWPTIDGNVEVFYAMGIPYDHGYAFELLRTVLASTGVSTSWSVSGISAFRSYLEHYAENEPLEFEGFTDWIAENWSLSSPTQRFSIPLLRAIQIYLGLYWANWAELPISFVHPHVESGRTVEYSVAPDGTLTLTSDIPSSGGSNAGDLEWSRSVVMTETGAWTNNATFEVDYTIPVLKLIHDHGVTPSRMDDEAAAMQAAIDRWENARDAAKADRYADFLAAWQQDLADATAARPTARYYQILNGTSSGGISDAGYLTDAPSTVWDKIFALFENTTALFPGPITVYIPRSNHYERFDFTRVNAVCSTIFTSTFASWRDAAIAAQDGFSDVVDWTSEWMDDGTMHYPFDVPSGVDEYGNPLSTTVTMSVVSSRKVPAASGHSATVPSVWPAAALFGGGYVAALKMAVSDGVVTDDFHAYEVAADGRSYVPTRTPACQNYARLVFREESVSPSTAAIGQLANYLAAKGLEANEDLMDSHALPLLPIIATGAAAADSTVRPADAVPRLGFWYHPTRSPRFSAVFPAEPLPPGGDLYLPYKICAAVGGTQYWAYATDGTSGNLTARGSYHDDSHSQSGSAATCAESFNVSRGTSAALRAVWDWKSLPVRN